MSVEIHEESHAVPNRQAHSSGSSLFTIAILLFLSFNCLYLLTSTGRVRSIDEIDPVLQSQSLLLRQSTAIPQAVNSGIYFGKFDIHGVPRSAWPAGHAILVLPWTAIGTYLFARLPGVPGNISDLAVDTAICWSNATFAALAVAISFLLFLKLDLAPKRAMACSLVLGLCTPLFVYSGWLYSEPATIAILVMAAFLLFGSGMPISLPRAIAASLLLGFAVHIRPANMMTAFVFIAASLVADYSVASQSSKSRFAYCTTAILIAILAISGLIYLARNYSLFGSPFDFGVPATAENGKDLDSWHNPFWVGIFGFLFSPGKAALLFCPPAILGILGLPRLWQRNRGLAVLCGGAPIANLFLYSVRTQWEGGYCYGPRYLVPSLILLTLPCAALLQTPPAWLRPVFWTTTIVGFLVQAIGLSTNIVEDMVVNHYFVGNWDYRMSYSPITGQLRLIWKYLHVSPTGLGLGWDRWFVFLHAAGASVLPLTIIASIFLLGTLVFGCLTWKNVRLLS
jgi:hypothetical protein